MLSPRLFLFFFFFNDTATTEIYTLSLHDALPISPSAAWYSFSQSAYFFVNSASLMPFAGETRVTESPTRRSSLPSPFTSATQTRVACVGPVRSLSRRSWPGLTGGLGLISGRNGSSSGSLPLPALFCAQ